MLDLALLILTSVIASTINKVMEESAVENGMECREKGKASKHKHNGKRDRNKNVSVKRNEPLSVIDSGDSLIGNNAVAGSNIGINNGGKSSIKSVARVALYALTLLLHVISIIA